MGGFTFYVSRITRYAIGDTRYAMIVHVKLYASLRRYRPEVGLGQPFLCAVPDDATVGQLALEILRLPSEEAAITLVNGVYQSRAHHLSDGDTVAVWPPIAGGSR